MPFNGPRSLCSAFEAILGVLVRLTLSDATEAKYGPPTRLLSLCPP